MNRPPVSKITTTLLLFSDGGARGNPGPAAGAYVIVDSNGKVIDQGGKFLGKATNNQAEYQGLILGMGKALEYRPNILHVYMDSELIVCQLNQEYRVKDSGLKPLFAQVQELRLQFPTVTFSHIPREKNKQADKLVNKTIDHNMR